MDERVRFVGRLLDGESMSEVCRQFGISRKTGYKIWGRHKDEGLEALCDRSRRPMRYANQLPEQIERLVVQSKREKPHGGARKIRELLVRKLAGDVRILATARAILHAHINQPLEMPPVRADVASWLGVPGGRPDLLIRFGRGERMPMPLRRELHEVIARGDALQP